MNTQLPQEHILILNGAMGTMILRYQLNETHSRIAKHIPQETPCI